MVWWTATRPPKAQRARARAVRYRMLRPTQVPHILVMMTLFKMVVMMAQTAESDLFWE